MFGNVTALVGLHVTERSDCCKREPQPCLQMSMEYEQIDKRFDFTANDLSPEKATFERKRNDANFL